MLWESFFGSAQHLRLMNMQEWNATQSDRRETKYRKIIKSLNWSNRKKLTTRDYIMDHALLLGLSQSVSEVSVRYGDYCNFIPWTCYPVPCIRYSQLSTKHYPQSLHPSTYSSSSAQLSKVRWPSSKSSPLLVREFLNRFRSGCLIEGCADQGEIFINCLLIHIWGSVVQW